MNMFLADAPDVETQALQSVEPHVYDGKLVESGLHEVRVTLDDVLALNALETGDPNLLLPDTRDPDGQTVNMVSAGRNGSIACEHLE